MNNKNHSPYSTAFTAGALLYDETNLLLPILTQENAEELRKKEIKENNFLMINSLQSRRTISREVMRRVKIVSPNFWKFYEEQNEAVKRVCLLYVCMKTYKLIFDFHFNVTVKQWNSAITTFDQYLYEMELSQIAVNDEFIANLSDVTRYKVIKVYKTMLKQAGMSDGINIQMPKVQAEELKYFAQIGEEWFLEACSFPVYTIREIKETLR